MKKIICTLFAVVILLFSACESLPTESPAQNPTATPSQTPYPTPAPEESLQTDNFSITHQKYEYKGNNVTILHIENLTDKAYTVTLNVKYLSSSGNVIKTEQRTFEGFPAKWRNNFIFQPKIKYDDFEVEVTTQDYAGKTYADNIDIDGTGPGYVKLIQAYSDSECNLYLWKENEDCKLMACVFAAMPTKANVYECEGTLGCKSEALVIDANGVILYIDDPIYEGNMTTNLIPYEGESLVPLYGTKYTWQERDKYVVPDNLKTVTIIDSILWIGEE